MSREISCEKLRGLSSLLTNPRFVIAVERQPFVNAQADH
jgi:hypothetical protein